MHKVKEPERKAVWVHDWLPNFNHNKDTMSNLDQDKAAVLSGELSQIDREYPCMSFIPNIGQEKAFSFYRTLDSSPYIMLFGGGNGVGKTANLAIMMVGLIWGPDYLNEFFDDYKAFEEYQELLRTRRRRGVIRVVLNADSMKEGGSVFQAITEWFPIGPDPKKPMYKMLKQGKNHFSQIVIAMDGAPLVEIKTHDQDTVAHSGTTVDWILCDEPFPQQHWGEMLGRTRDGGRIAMFMTPLNMAGWLLDDVVEQVDGVDTCMTNASIWENCIDIPNTRGHLKKKNIDKMIRQWEISSPNEVDARVKGTFSHLTGAIFKAFSPKVHIIEPFKIPLDWPVYMIVDPHDSKAPFVTWILQGPNNRHWVIKEWPEEDFTKLGNTDLTISKSIDVLKEIERPFAHQIVRRLMDPNKGSFVYSNTKKTIQDEWRVNGMRCDLVRVDDLDVGHKAVSRLIWWDQQKPSEPGFNQPALQIFNTCTNTSKSLQRYGLKKNHDPGASLTTKIDKKYKDPVDNVRYYATDRRDFVTITEKNSFMEKIYNGRKPITFKGQQTARRS